MNTPTKQSLLRGITKFKSRVPSDTVRFWVPIFHRNGGVEWYVIATATASIFCKPDGGAQKNLPGYLLSWSGDFCIDLCPIWCFFSSSSIPYILCAIYKVRSTHTNLHMEPESLDNEPGPGYKWKLWETIRKQPGHFLDQDWRKGGHDPIDVFQNTRNIAFTLYIID